ncbi:zinc finger and BTB domain-containing protein 26 isoform X2 [Stegastes partitus]|uniref:Zinc finger and BTB domain containing 26 n=1 Tax=Stegastes partitus TaxID=144197 RepID=A0A3B4ZD98_9TELE|nr:PREDICTED: zinc finger and BTB domain-containing protein 26 isoform X2 [Stegastes partitus]
MSLQNKAIMTSSSETLQFTLPTHGDSMLSNMNILREEGRFCDITLVLGDAQGSTAEPFLFHGHRVVLAASSDFLRDQFLLHEGRAELSVAVVSSVEVAETLLLSCYTGLLEVPLRELVSYLTAASALQMGQVVEKCSQAISQFLSPTLAFLKLGRHSEKKERQLEGSWLGTSFENQKEEDAAQPSTSIQEANIKERGAAVIQSKLRVSQEAEVDSQGLREIREDWEAVKAEREESEDAACCLDNLELEEVGEIQLFHTNNQRCHVHHIEGPLKCRLHHPASFQDIISSPASTIGRSSAANEELMESTQNQHEPELEEPREEENTPTAAAQREKVAAGSMLVQRPYLCRRCDKVFQHLESYVGHLKEHRQYSCLVCEKGFSQKSNLTRHIRVHAGAKPFRCPLCHKTFTQKAMLQDHLDLHTGDRPHKCNYTAVHFAHKAGLRCHLREGHGKRSLQNVLEEAVDCQ